MNTREAGKDYETDLSNAANALLAGNAQADIYGNAADIATRGGLLDAATKLATGGYELSKVYKDKAPPKETPKEPPKA